MGGDTDDHWLVHRAIHKGVRRALFEITTAAGRIDGTDDAAVEALESSWRDVQLVLDGHQHAEQRCYAPLVSAHAAHLQDEGVRLHAEDDAAIDAIDTLLARLWAATLPQRVVLLGVLHLDLADLAAGSIRHLRFEEDCLMPALAAADPADLAAAASASLCALPVDDLEILVRLVLPALGQVERSSVVSAIAAAVPASTFEHLQTDLAPATATR